MKRPALTTIALLSVLATGVGLASAGLQTEFPTFFVKFKFEASSGEKFSGKIDSSKGKCVDGRKVTVYRKKSGDKTKLGSDKTNDKGKFKVGVGNGPPKDGKYLAQVKQSTFEANDGNRITCKPETSVSVKIS